eukprot:TRINITY_DN12306_c0_g1_i1.p1 TRINITY_DN12306_c0_g1~~TRINITY_DN12306_c0_g1_i1.p1  ORF type:complete len:673 (+),score=203.89 TRINITY_DN12306_c0_g1_i1:68-2020(+)
MATHYERCTGCGKCTDVDYDLAEWDQQGDCDRCGRETRWELLRVPTAPTHRAPAKRPRPKQEPREQQAPQEPQSDPKADCAAPCTQQRADTKQGIKTEPGVGSAAQVPDWALQSEWAAVFCCGDDGRPDAPAAIPEYAAARPAVTMDEMRELYEDESEMREHSVALAPARSAQQWAAEDAEQRKWADYIGAIDEARWRTDREAVLAALPAGYTQHCTPAGVAAVAEIRRATIIGDALRPLSREELVELHAEYEEGCSIIPLAAKFGRPPMQLLKVLLTIRYPGVDLADAARFQLWRMPGRYVSSDRDIREVLSCSQRDTVASAEQQWELRERLCMAEQVLVRWLEKTELRFWCRQQLPAEAAPLPFVLLLDSLIVNDRAVMWIEIVDTYGLPKGNTVHVVNRRVAELEERWGTGLLLFLNGYSPAMPTPWAQTAAADPRDLSPELRQLLELVQCSHLRDLREKLRFEIARLFEHQSAAKHYAPPDDTPLPSIRPPQARPVQRRREGADTDSEGGGVKREDGDAAQPRAKRHCKTGRGSRTAAASVRDTYKQVWDITDREVERIRAARAPPIVAAPRPGRAPRRTHVKIPPPPPPPTRRAPGKSAERPKPTPGEPTASTQPPGADSAEPPGDDEASACELQVPLLLQDTEF